MNISSINKKKIMSTQRINTTIINSCLEVNQSSTRMKYDVNVILIKLIVKVFVLKNDTIFDVILKTFNTILRNL